MSTKRTQTHKVSQTSIDLARSLSEDARHAYENAFRLKTLAAEQLRLAEEDEQLALRDYNKAEDQYVALRDMGGGK